MCVSRGVGSERAMGRSVQRGVIADKTISAVGYWGIGGMGHMAIIGKEVELGRCGMME